MVERFRKLCPGVDINQYLEFFCLHNYGILNNQFVHDQIYIHDKLICVDDRVLIIGSANINDRSMTGDRDSEVAIRIEDTNTKTIILGGASFGVGNRPHCIRMQLMRQHLGDEFGKANIEDIVSPANYEMYWKAAAMNNAGHYSAIDGARDVFNPKNQTLNPYKEALLNYENQKVDDKNVINALSQFGGIKGTLYPFPMSLLKQEDLSPSLAVRSIIPSTLWV